MKDLKKYHTRHLLNALQEFRVYNTVSQMYDYYSEQEIYTTGPNFYCGKRDGEFIVYLDHMTDPVTEDELKAELATREHIPNKIEAKELRRVKAKAQRNR